MDNNHIKLKNVLSTGHHDLKLELSKIMNLDWEEVQEMMPLFDVEEGEVLLSLINDNEEKLKKELTKLYKVYIREKEEREIQRGILDQLIEGDNWKEFYTGCYIKIKQETSKQKMKESLKKGYAVCIGASNTEYNFINNKYFVFFDKNSMEFYLIKAAKGLFKPLNDNTGYTFSADFQEGFLDINSSVKTLESSVKRQKVSLQTVEELIEEYLELIQEKEERLAVKISEVKEQKTDKEKKEEAINDWFSM